MFQEGCRGEKPFRARRKSKSNTGKRTGDWPRTRARRGGFDHANALLTCPPLFEIVIFRRSAEARTQDYHKGQEQLGGFIVISVSIHRLLCRLISTLRAVSHCGWRFVGIWNTSANCENQAFCTMFPGREGRESSARTYTPVEIGALAWTKGETPVAEAGTGIRAWDIEINAYILENGLP